MHDIPVAVYLVFHVTTENGEDNNATQLKSYTLQSMYLLIHPGIK